MHSTEQMALEFGRLRFEPDGLLWRGRTRVPLPPKETALLSGSGVIATAILTGVYVAVLR